MSAWRFVARLCALAAWAFMTTAHAEESLTLRIAGAYIELHTGPGGGYPIFHVAERGETIEVLKSKVDWFKVRTQSQKEGWVSLAQLEATLMTTGDPLHLPKASITDYFARHVEMGVAAGLLEDEPMMSLRVAYLAHPNFALDFIAAFTENMLLSCSAGTTLTPDNCVCSIVPSANGILTGRSPMPTTSIFELSLFLIFPLACL